MNQVSLVHISRLIFLYLIDIVCYLRLLVHIYMIFHFVTCLSPVLCEVINDCSLTGDLMHGRCDQFLPNSTLLSL